MINLTKICIALLHCPADGRMGHTAYWSAASAPLVLDQVWVKLKRLWGFGSSGWPPGIEQERQDALQHG